MTTFAASVFDPENDEHKPKVGDKTNDEKYEIMEVLYVPAKELLEELMSDKEPDMRGHDNLLVFDHPERPFVKYKVWVKNLEKNGKEH